MSRCRFSDAAQTSHVVVKEQNESIGLSLYRRPDQEYVHSFPFVFRRSVVKQIPYRGIDINVQSVLKGVFTLCVFFLFACRKRGRSSVGFLVIGNFQFLIIAEIGTRSATRALIRVVNNFPGSVDSRFRRNRAFLRLPEVVSFFGKPEHFVGYITGFGYAACFNFVGKTVFHKVGVLFFFLASAA